MKPSSAFAIRSPSDLEADCRMLLKMMRFFYVQSIWGRGGRVLMKTLQFGGVNDMMVCTAFFAS